MGKMIYNNNFMKQLIFFPVCIISALLIRCASAPAAESPHIDEAHPVSVFEEQVQEAEPIPEPDTTAAEQKLYDDTLADIQHFVDDLNAIISKKNYSQWKTVLSDEYFSHISSAEFLAQASASPALKSKKIILKTPNDYFLNVVVPSRSNSRADAIEFITADHVKVIFIDERNTKNDKNETTAETRRLRLFNLVKDGDTWKINE